MLNRCLSAVMAGMLISIGCCAYASVENRVVGALLFSLGLMSVVIYRLMLYTGKVGCLGKGFSTKDLAIMFACNGLGCAAFCAIASMAGLPCLQQLEAIATAKLAARPWHQVMAAAVICGMLMEIGVASWREDREAHAAKSFITIAAVMAFILTGAEHSVANFFYVLFGHGTIAGTCLFIALCFIGNGIGGVLANRLLSRL